MNSLLDLTPEELEFFTEECYVKILPNFTLNSIELISGTIGPLKPNFESQVPLWFAIHLRKSRKCKMVPPATLSEDALRDMLVDEKKAEVLSNIEFKLFDIFNAFDR